MPALSQIIGRGTLPVFKKKGSFVTQSLWLGWMHWHSICVRVRFARSVEPSDSGWYALDIRNSTPISLCSKDQLGYIPGHVASRSFDSGSGPTKSIPIASHGAFDTARGFSSPYGFWLAVISTRLGLAANPASCTALGERAESHCRDPS